MNVNTACHSPPAFKQGGTSGTSSAPTAHACSLHWPDETVPIFFLPPSSSPPLSFSGDDARLRHTCFSPLGSGLSVIPPGFPPTFAAVFRQSCLCRRLILLFIFCSSSSLLSVRAAGDGRTRWSPLHGLALDGYSHSRCISEVLTGKTCRWNGKAVRPSAGNFPCPSLKRPGPPHSRLHICK